MLHKWDDDCIYVRALLLHWCFRTVSTILSSNLSSPNLVSFYALISKRDYISFFTTEFLKYSTKFITKSGNSKLFPN
jgi:hypothetical protein